VLVVLRRPQAQLEQGCGQGRDRIEQRRGRTQLVGWHVTGVSHLDQNADQFAPTERHAQPHAWHEGLARGAGWRTVVEQPAQRRRKGKAQDDVGHAADL